MAEERRSNKLKFLPLARMQHNCSWPIDFGNHYNLSSVYVHGVNAAIGRVGPIDFLMYPIISDAFRIYTRFENNRDVLDFGLVCGQRSYYGFGADLCEEQF